MVAAALAFARSASASCAVSVSGTPLRPAADVIFDGVLLDGPNDTPFEHFQVIRYVKSDRSAQRVEAVVTGCQTFTSLELAGQTSLSIDARPGEVWRIYAGRRADGALETNTCGGSTRLALSASAEELAAAPTVEPTTRRLNRVRGRIAI